MAIARERLNAGIAEVGEKMLLAARDLSDVGASKFAGNAAADVLAINASILNPSFRDAFIKLVDGSITTVADVQALNLSLEEKAILRDSFDI